MEKKVLEKYKKKKKEEKKEVWQPGIGFEPISSSRTSIHLGDVAYYTNQPTTER